MNRNDDLEPLLNRQQAAAYLNVSIGTLAVWDCTKRHNLEPIKIGNRVRYRRSTVKELPENDQQRIKEGTAMVLYPQQDAKLSKDEFKQHKDMDRSQDFAMSVLAESYREKNLSKQPSAKSKDQTLREMNFPQFYQSLNVQQGYGEQKQKVTYSKDTHEITGRKIEAPEQNKLSDTKETKAIEAPKSREEQFMERIGIAEESYSEQDKLMSDYEQNRDDITDYDSQDIGDDLEPDMD